AQRVSSNRLVLSCPGFFKLRGWEMRIELYSNFAPRPLDVDLETLKNARGNAFSVPEQSKQNVFGANVRVIERLGFLSGERQDFFHPRCVRNVADNFCFRTGANLLLDFHSDGLEIEPHFLENVDCDALAELDQSEQKVLGAD